MPKKPPTALSRRVKAWANVYPKGVVTLHASKTRAKESRRKDARTAHLVELRPGEKIVTADADGKEI